MTSSGTPLVQPTRASLSAFLIVALAAGWQAWQLRFIQDDAYISFRYAENLARGFGLVWNEGERVEGYTNFLWTVILALPHATGTNVERFATWLGIVLFIGTLAIFYVLAATLTRSWFSAAAATLALGLFPSFAAFATGGLETQLQAFLLTATFALVHRGLCLTHPSTPVALGIGTASALALLTRMDSIVVVAPAIGLYGWSVLSTHGRRAISAVLSVVAVPLVFCGPWLGWKMAYYGSVLPNSFNAKVEGPGGLRQGVRYLITFVQAYAFYLPVACVPVGAWLVWERRLDRTVFALLTVPVILWAVYIVLVGGDFMEYRFVVPVLPLLFLMTYWVMCARDGSAARAALLTTLVIAGGIVAYRSPKVPKPLGSPLPLPDLAVTPEQEWYEIGSVLGASFAHGVRPKIAVVPAGVIPYRSRLPAVDMLGLNDKDVNQFIRMPYELVGHRRLAPLDLLEQRQVNLLIAFPVVRARLASGMHYRFSDFERRPYRYSDEHRLKGRQLIEVPLSNERVLFMVYLTEDAALTARIDQLKWIRYPLD